MLTLEKDKTALIIIDLQKGILDPEPVPFGREQIVRQAVSLGHAFAKVSSPIVLTTTDFAPGYADAPKGLPILRGNFPRRACPQNLQRSFPK